jgi:predicted RNA-binding protein YlxR (DUF448 family)
MTGPIRQRTCRACRKKKDKRELLRLVILNNKTLELDLRQVRPGRGWYLCRREPCLSVLMVPKGRQKAFGRSLELGPGVKNHMTILPAGGVNGQN